jgi:hypothetical protein
VVCDHGGFHRVQLLLARDEGAASAAACHRPADLDLGGVQPQLNTLDPGTGEHIFQGTKPQTRAVGNSKTPFREQSAHLANGTGDG